MNIPTNRVFQLHTSDQVYLRRILTTEIKLIQDSQYILHQVPFELNKIPNQVWKQTLINFWHSTTHNKECISETILWVFHDRILVDKVSIEQVGNELEILVTDAINKTNKQMAMRGHLFI